MKIYVTSKELNKLKIILLEYNRIEGVDYTQINKIDSNNSEQQWIEFKASIHVLNKIKSYLKYYIYPFRNLEIE